LTWINTPQPSATKVGFNYQRPSSCQRAPLDDGTCTRLTDEDLPMPSPSEDTGGKRRERRLFLFLVIFLFPLLSMALVGTYGFAVWFLQMLFGPPGPPH